MSDSLKDIFDSGSCLVEEAGNIPAEIFREICFNVGMTTTKWDKLLTKYLDTVDGGSLSRSKKGRERNNINRELGNRTITWNKLTQFINILKPYKVEYKLDLKWNIQTNKEPIESITLDSRYKGGILKTFFTKAFDDVIDDPRTWDTLVCIWIDKLEDIDPNNPVDRSTERGNIQKTIRSRDNFTWNMFCKSMSILGVGEMDLRLSFSTIRGKDVTCVINKNIKL